MLPALLFLANLRLYVPPKPSIDNEVNLPKLSVLIPARNEEASIGAAMASVLDNQNVSFELLVLDDHSEDNTRQIVQEYAQRDSRVRLIEGPDLPEGWAGKQHACYVLAQAASNDYLVFLDADVRLAPDALQRMLGFMESSKVALGSGVPRQITVGILEKLILPMIHFILLGFLPIASMRKSAGPEFGAGCGQLFIARKEEYFQCQGHAGIRASFHDGLQLPRLFRKSGFFTDLFDATELASCRMYHSAHALWFGLAKNAREGLAGNKLIVPATALLFCGQVLPFMLLPFVLQQAYLLAVVVSAIIFAYLPRFLAVWRFRQSVLGAVLHPFGVLLFLGIQWFALIRGLMGKPISWKGRPQIDQATTVS